MNVPKGVYAEGMKSMTLIEAAAALGLATATLRHQIRNGRLRARKIGPLWLIAPREIERYRAENLGRAGRPAKHG